MTDPHCPDELREYELPEWLQMEQDEHAEKLRRIENNWTLGIFLFLAFVYGVWFIIAGMK